MSKETGEKVVFRVEKKPIYGELYYLAVFPEEAANPGRLAYTPFVFRGDKPIFYPHDELDLKWYYNNTRIVHKGTELAAKCLDAITSYYTGPFTVREKL